VKDLIMKWLHGKVLAVLDNKSYTSPVEHYYYAYLGVDNRTHSFSVIVNGDRLLPLSKREKGSPVKLLEGGSIASDNREKSVFDILDEALESFDTRDEWFEKSTKPMTPTKLQDILAVVTQKAVSNIYSVRSENFRVSNVRVLTLNQVMVDFVFNEIPYLPIPLTLGTTTAVRERNFGVHTQEFKQFVEDLIASYGKIVWVQE